MTKNGTQFLEIFGGHNKGNHFAKVDPNVSIRRAIRCHQRIRTEHQNCQHGHADTQKWDGRRRGNQSRIVSCARIESECCRRKNPDHVSNGGGHTKVDSATATVGHATRHQRDASRKTMHSFAKGGGLGPDVVVVGRHGVEKLATRDSFEKFGECKLLLFPIKCVCVCF